jgi:hypothetical protein
MRALFRFFGLRQRANVRNPDVPVAPISTSRNPSHGFMWIGLLTFRLKHKGGLQKGLLGCDALLCGTEILKHYTAPTSGYLTTYTASRTAVAYREGGGAGGFKPSPKFRSFDTAEPNSLFRRKYIRNRLVFLFRHPN